MNQHWPLTRLGDIFDIGRGGSPRPIEKFITDDPSGLNWIKIGDATSGGKFIEKTREKIKREGLSKTRAVKPGDFLLTNSMSFGRPYIMAIEGCIHDGWLLLRPRKKEFVHPDYFYYLIGSDQLYNQFSARAGGSTVKNLNSDIVSSIEVRLPSLDEQRRIAAILDKADALRRKRKRALELLDGLTQSIFLEMFPPSRNSNYIDLGTAVTEFRYGTSNKSTDVGHPVLRIPNVVGGEIDLSDLKTVPLEAKEFARLQMKHGDLLLVRTNGNPEYVGRCAVMDDGVESVSGKPLGSFVFASYLIRARLDQSRFDPYFVQAYLSSRAGRKAMLERAKTSAGQFNVNTEGLASIPIPAADLDLQKRFSSALSALRISKLPLFRSQTVLDSAFSSLQHRAFNGQL